MILTQRLLTHITLVMCLVVAGCHLRPLNTSPPPRPVGESWHTTNEADQRVEPSLVEKQPRAECERTAPTSREKQEGILVPLDVDEVLDAGAERPLVTYTSSANMSQLNVSPPSRPGVMTVGYEIPEASDDGPILVTSQWSLANPQTNDLGFDEQPVDSPVPGWTAPHLPAESRPISLRYDARNLPHDLWDDTKSIVTWKNALVLGAGAGLAVGLRQHTDHEAREFVNEHPLRWGVGSKILRMPGEPQYQVPVLAGVYAYSLYRQDPEFHNVTRATISSFSIASLASVALKGITNTRRPSDEFLDGRWGFPSAHVASCFAISATLDEYYGWPTALPLYALSGLVGWSRIDQREHDVSDVVFGSLMGFVIGHSVARAHLNRDSQFQIEPWVDPLQRASGVQMVIPY